MLEQLRRNAGEADEYRRRDLLDRPPEEISPDIDEPENEPAAAAAIDGNRTGRRVRARDNQDQRRDELGMPDRQFHCRSRASRDTHDNCLPDLKRQRTLA